MDIVVCKSRDYFKGTYGGLEVCFWPIPDSKKPTKILVGDRVFVVVDGFVKHYHKFLGFVVDPICADGSINNGLNMVLSYPPQDQKPPIRFKRFPHFRYISV